MGNLNYPKAILLYNSLAVTDVSVYEGSDGHYHLLFKDKGIDLTMYEVTAGQGTLNVSTLTVCANSCTDDGELREVCILPQIPCPCEDCNYEWGITINHIEKTRGVFTQWFPPPQKFYGTRLNKVECGDDGLIDDIYVLQYEDEIINMINADQYAFVTAKRKYVYTGWEDGDTPDITVTLEDGTEIVLAGTGGEADLDALITKFESDDTNSVLTFGTDDDPSSDEGSFYIEYEGVFSVSALDGDLDSVTRYLCIVQKYTDVSFTVEYPQGTAEQTVVTEGRFPALTGADVFRIFANAGHHGTLANIVSTTKPDPTKDYCLYQFKMLHPFKYDLVGASHLNQYFQYVDVYIEQVAAETNIWDSQADPPYHTDVAPQNPDTSWEDLFEIICNGSDDRGQSA